MNRIKLEDLGAGDSVLCATANHAVSLKHKLTHGVFNTRALPHIVTFKHWLSQEYTLHSTDEVRFIDSYEQYVIVRQLLRSIDEGLLENTCNHMAKLYVRAFNSQCLVEGSLDCDERYLPELIAGYKSFLARHKLIDISGLIVGLHNWYWPSCSQRVFVHGAGALTSSSTQLNQLIQALQPHHTLHMLAQTTPSAKCVRLRFAHPEWLLDWLSERVVLALKNNADATVGLLLHDVSIKKRLLMRLNAYLRTQTVYAEHSALVKEQRMLACKVYQCLPFFERPMNAALLGFFKALAENKPDAAVAIWPFSPLLKEVGSTIISKAPECSPCGDANLLESLQKWCDDELNHKQCPGNWSLSVERLLVTLCGERVHLTPECELDWEVWQRAFIIANTHLCRDEEVVSFATWWENVLIYLDYESVSHGAGRIYLCSWQEAVDTSFDYLFQVHAHASTWPDPSEEAPIGHWQAIQSRLSAASGHWVLESARDFQDQVQLESALFANIPLECSNSQHSCSEELGQACEWYPEPSCVVAVQDDEYKVSTSALQSMLNCPTQSFIAHRLGCSQDAEELAFGLGAHTLGILLHELLAADKTVVTLHGLSKVLERLGARIPAWSLEPLQSWLERTLCNWRRYEEEVGVQRVGVLSSVCEQKVTLDVDLLTVQMRVDRIDYFADGSCHVIDYKLGAVTKSEWMSAPLASVQMPLYALAVPKCLGLHYACLHPDAYGYSGVSAAERYPKSHFPKLSASQDAAEYSCWDTLQQYWQRSITHIAKQYALGKVENRPIKQETTCERCAFTMVCRRFERKSC